MEILFDSSIYEFDANRTLDLMFESPGFDNLNLDQLDISSSLLTPAG